jgi:hypothetical protein
LFEIIYPEDLHVVTYKDVDDIFLLAIISTENYFEYPVELMKKYLPVVKKYYCNDWKNIRNIIDGTNREGFVVKIGPMRIKLKYEEYWRLHYLKAGLSEKMIRKCLVDGDMGPVNEALTMFDEEHVMYHNNIIKKYYLSNWKECRQLVDGTNREGFVIKIGPLRVKMKYEEYWRLHYLKAGLSEKMIRKCLVDGDMGPVDEALTMFDEEHVLYYKRIMDKYTDKFAEIIDKCVEEYRNDFETQKDAAAYFFTCRYPHILLRMYKGQSYEQITWKYVCREVKNTTDEMDD